MRLTRNKTYKPPKNVEEQIMKICKDIIGDKAEYSDLKQFKFHDLNLKYTVIVWKKLFWLCSIFI